MLLLQPLRLELVHLVMLVKGLGSSLKLGMGLGMIVGWMLIRSLIRLVIQYKSVEHVISISTCPSPACHRHITLSIVSLL